HALRHECRLLGAPTMHAAGSRWNSLCHLRPHLEAKNPCELRHIDAIDGQHWMTLLRSLAPRSVALAMRNRIDEMRRRTCGSAQDFEMETQPALLKKTTPVDEYKHSAHETASDDYQQGFT